MSQASVHGPVGSGYSPQSDMSVYSHGRVISQGLTPPSPRDGYSPMSARSDVSMRSQARPDPALMTMAPDISPSTNHLYAQGNAYLQSPLRRDVSQDPRSDESGAPYNTLRGRIIQPSTSRAPNLPYGEISDHTYDWVSQNRSHNISDESQFSTYAQASQFGNSSSSGSRSHYSYPAAQSSYPYIPPPETEEDRWEANDGSPDGTPQAAGSRILAPEMLYKSDSPPSRAPPASRGGPRRL